MHAIFFNLKRAFHSSLRFPQKVTRRYGLTPARFDIMYLIDQAYGYVSQRSLRETLGVSRTTVSRMLRSLEEIGMIRRRCAGDRRTREVYLSDVGRSRFRRAARELWGSGLADLVVESLSSWSREPGAIFRNMCTLESHLRWIRDTSGDTATLHYPWHPDD